MFWLLNQLDTLFLLPFSTFQVHWKYPCLFPTRIYSFFYLQLFFSPNRFLVWRKFEFFVPSLHLTLDILSTTFFVFLTLTKACHSSELQFTIWTMGTLALSILPTSQGLGKAGGTWESSRNRKSSVNLSCYEVHGRKPSNLAEAKIEPREGKPLLPKVTQKAPASRLLGPILLSGLQTAGAAGLGAQQLRIQKRQGWHK